MKNSLRLLVSSLAVFIATASASAQAFVGSDNFNSGSDAKWDYAFRTLGNSGGNGELTFTNARLDFTKSSGDGSYFLGWDGAADGQGGGTFSRTTASLTTSWVADLVVTSTYLTGVGEYTSLGLEISGSGGQYTALMLQNIEGQTRLRSESSGAVSASQASLSNTDVTLRLAWDANAQTLSTFYSYDLGNTFSAFTGYSPVATWTAGAAAGGFYFEVFAASNAAGAITTGQMYADNFSVSAIPEPSTYAAMAGVAALGLAIWRRRHAAKPTTA